MKSLVRGLRIVYIANRYQLQHLIPLHQLPWWLALLIRLWPTSWLPKPQHPAQNLRLALEDLGPIFVKFGQILSTRRDLLSPEFANELSKLQDRVPPFSGQDAARIISKALNSSIEELFVNFDYQPLASASIAQVHSATLHDGRDIVVKVIRPTIRPVIDQDLALLALIAKLVTLSKDGARLRPVEVVEDYRQTVLDELDLMREGANASTLKRNFSEGGLLYVPEIHWDYCRTNVLVMERIYGVPVANIDDMRAAGVDFKVLAERGVEIFFAQVFRDSFFHADMHPGNIFVDITEPSNPSYIGIDCGIVGTLSDEDQNYLAQNLLAFFERDYQRVAQLHVESGWVPATTKVRDFESAIRSVCEPIFEKPLADISFGLVLVRLFQTARRFNMQVQPQLVLLEKTLLNIEGLGRQLYPQLDLWATAKPFLKRWMSERIGGRRLLSEVKKQAPLWLDYLPKMPEQLLQALQAQKEQQLSMQRLLLLQQQQAEQARLRHRWFILSVVALLALLFYKL